MLKLNEDTMVDVPTMYFDNDDEFYIFSVDPNIITTPYTRADGTTGYVADWDFTQGYKDAVADGVRFIIKDEDSQIYKHKAITHRVATKPISNLEQYFKKPNKLLKGVKKLDTYITDEENQ